MLSPRLEACSTALPAHYYSQEELLAGLESLWQAQHFNQQRLRQLHAAMGISGRYLALPKEQYLAQASFTERNREFQRVSLELAERAVQGVLEEAGVAADEVDYLVYTTVTGLAVPSLDARLMNRIGFRSDLKRLPMFGWGCLGGAAGASRLADLLRSQAPARGLLLSVELCSLTLQPGDLSVANLVASGLFGDGAAAVLMSSGHAAKGPRVIATRSVFFSNSEDVMGWDIGEHGFGIVLTPQVPYQAEHNLVPALTRFLAEFSLSPDDIGAWVAHPGGPKVIDVVEQALRLEGALDITRKSLTDIGNLSSASVLFVLRDVLQQNHPPGTYGVMLAMGPGFCAELLLLQW